MVWLGTKPPMVRPPHLTLVLAGLAFGTAVRHSTEVPFERFLELTACNIASNGSEVRTHRQVPEALRFPTTSQRVILSEDRLVEENGFDATNFTGHRQVPEALRNRAISIKSQP